MASEIWKIPEDEDESKLDPLYLRVRNGTLCEEVRVLVDELWEKYEPYCGDRDFVSRLRCEFNQLTWQMYVGGCLLDSGLDLQQGAPAGPDHCVLAGDRKIWIECIAPQAGDGNNEAKRTYGFVQSQGATRSGTFRPPPDDKIALRLTGAIWEKHQQRDVWIADGILAEEEPYVVAVGAGDIPDADIESELPLIVKVLYGIGEPLIRYEIGGDSEPEVVGTHRDFISRGDRPPISARGFLNELLKGTSAVLLGPSGILNPPRVPGRDLIWVHNAKANNPVDRGFLAMGREFWATTVLEQHDHRESLPEPELSDDLVALIEQIRSERDE